MNAGFSSNVNQPSLSGLVDITCDNLYASNLAIDEINGITNEEMLCLQGCTQNIEDRFIDDEALIATNASNINSNATNIATNATDIDALEYKTNRIAYDDSLIKYTLDATTRISNTLSVGEAINCDSDITCTGSFTIGGSISSQGINSTGDIFGKNIYLIEPGADTVNNVYHGDITCGNIYSYTRESYASNEDVDRGKIFTGDIETTHISSVDTTLKSCNDKLAGLVAYSSAARLDEVWGGTHTYGETEFQGDVKTNTNFTLTNGKSLNGCYSLITPLEQKTTNQSYTNNLTSFTGTVQASTDVKIGSSISLNTINNKTSDMSAYSSSTTSTTFSHYVKASDFIISNSDYTSLKSTLDSTGTKLTNLSYYTETDANDNTAFITRIVSRLYADEIYFDQSAASQYRAYTNDKDDTLSDVAAKTTKMSYDSATTTTSFANKTYCNELTCGNFNTSYLSGLTSNAQTQLNAITTKTDKFTFTAPDQYHLWMTIAANKVTAGDFVMSDSSKTYSLLEVGNRCQYISHVHDSINDLVYTTMSNDFLTVKELTSTDLETDTITSLNDTIATLQSAVSTLQASVTALQKKLTDDYMMFSYRVKNNVVPTLWWVAGDQAAACRITGVTLTKVHLTYGYTTNGYKYYGINSSYTDCRLSIANTGSLLGTEKYWTLAISFGPCEIDQSDNTGLGNFIFNQIPDWAQSTSDAAHSVSYIHNSQTLTMDEHPNTGQSVSKVVDIGNWSNKIVVFVVSDTKKEIYVDGDLFHSGTWNETYAGAATTLSVWFNSNSTYTRPLKSITMCGSALWDRNLSADQIKKITWEGLLKQYTDN